MPARAEDRRTSTVISVLLHLLIIVLITADFSSHTGLVIEREQGAGGPGPAGGGGGGHRGTGGVREHIQYVQVAPPPAPTPKPQAVIPPPTPLPKPVVPPPTPPVVKPPEVIPEVKQAVAKMDIKAPEATAPTLGTGGGTGSDGTNGTGPGTGGGTGTGIGTGKGSGIGPGTGGGRQENYAPTPTELFLPPLPYPGKLHGFHLVAEFDVDENGKVLDWKFNPTGDGGYDRRLSDVLKSTRFRAGMTPDGKPIRMKAQIVYDF
jgi:protein TonB